MKKKIMYASSLVLLGLPLVSSQKAFAADSDYAIFKPHSMLTTAYAEAWNDVNKASDEKGTGEGKEAKEEKKAEKADEKADEKAEEKSKDKNGVKGKDAPKQGGGNVADADKAAKAEKKQKDKNHKKAAKSRASSNSAYDLAIKNTTGNNYYSNGGKAASGNGGN